ncbi:hypothetical protein [Domibacillus sp.]|nr:hypothetical protein [Domibacillus sp.]
MLTGISNLLNGLLGGGLIGDGQLINGLLDGVTGDGNLVYVNINL